MAKLGVAMVTLALVLAPEIAAAQVGAPPMPSVPPMAAPAPMPGAPMMHHGGPGMHRPPMVAPPRGPVPPMARPGPAPAAVYVQPYYGYTLPRTWIAPGYYINDYAAMGLPAPAFGYGWSRYHDDVVLTDRWGRVYDWRSAQDMRGDGRRPGYRKRDKSGIVGAIIGGAIGAVTGNLIAGAGSRLAGSLIGGGVGALAGQAIDSGRIGGRDGYHDGRYGDGYGYGYRAQGPHWFMGDYQGGYYAGCNCGGTVTTTTTTTTTYAQPVTTRKVSYVTEYVRVPAKPKYRPLRTKDRYLGY